MVVGWVFCMPFGCQNGRNALLEDGWGFDDLDGLTDDPLSA